MIIYQPMISSNSAAPHKKFKKNHPIVIKNKLNTIIMKNICWTYKKKKRKEKNICWSQHFGTKFIALLLFILVIHSK